jgi:hypothetical protein
MANHEGGGFVRRIVTALGRALERALLGKSAPSYVKQFTGSDEYWERALAAQAGWPRKPPPQPEPDRVPGPVNAPVRAGLAGSPGQPLAPGIESAAP